MQYSVTSSFRLAIVNGVRQNVLPGAFWVYDISPFMVVVSKKSTPFFEFLTGLCAIVGGVFTVCAGGQGVASFTNCVVLDSGFLSSSLRCVAWLTCPCCGAGGRHRQLPPVLLLEKVLDKVERASK